MRLHRNASKFITNKTENEINQFQMEKWNLNLASCGKWCEVEVRGNRLTSHRCVSFDNRLHGAISCKRFWFWPSTELTHTHSTLMCHRHQFVDPLFTSFLVYDCITITIVCTTAVQVLPTLPAHLPNFSHFPFCFIANMTFQLFKYYASLRNRLFQLLARLRAQLNINLNPFRQKFCCRLRSSSAEFEKKKWKFMREVHTFEIVSIHSFFSYFCCCCWTF